MRRKGLNIRKWFLRFVMPLLRRLPPAAATRFVTGIGKLEYALLSKVRVRFDSAVGRAEKELGGHWNVSEVARELVGNQIRWRARDLLLDGLPDRVVAPLFDVVGREHLDSALAEKQGVILLGNHYGAHMLPAHWLVRNHYPLRLFMERPRHVSRFLARYFETEGPFGQNKLFISRKAGPAEAAASIMRASRMLKAGMIVKLAADVRWSGPHTSASKFIDREYTFSSTWVALAALTGAPVVPVFCRMDADGRYRLEFLPSFRIAAAELAGGGTACRVREYLTMVEERIRLDPANSNDYFFWADAPLESNDADSVHPIRTT